LIGVESDRARVAGLAPLELGVGLHGPESETLLCVLGVVLDELARVDEVYGLVHELAVLLSPAHALE
jgi:hypothetical protein